MFRTEKFEHDGNAYESRLHGSGWDFTVKTYVNGERANGYSYSVSLPTAIDLKTVQNLDAIELLFEHAKRDIVDGVWQQFVEAHVASLKKTPEESLGCRKCGSRDILSSIVDERRMHECVPCGKIWYERRQMTGPYLVIVDEITEGVEKNGSHEAQVEILLNTAFRPQNGTGASFEDQLRNWTIQNKLKHEYRQDGKGRAVRFWR